MQDEFQTAYARARRVIGEDSWPSLNNEEQERAVAEALRSLECEPPRERVSEQ